MTVGQQRNRITDPERSHQLARRIGGRFVLANDSGHAMLGRPRRSREQATQFVREQLPEAALQEGNHSTIVWRRCAGPPAGEGNVGGSEQHGSSEGV